MVAIAEGLDEMVNDGFDFGRSGIPIDLPEGAGGQLPNLRVLVFEGDEESWKVVRAWKGSQIAPVKFGSSESIVSTAQPSS